MVSKSRANNLPNPASLLESHIPQNTATNSVTRSSQTPCFVLDKRYLIGRILGEGAHGAVHIAEDAATNQLVAVKIETRKPSTRNYTILAKEHMIYSELFFNEEPEGFIRPVGFYQNDSTDFMLLPLLGDTIERLYIERREEFDFMSVCELGLQMLTRLEDIHSKGVLHLDIKPSNMMVGVGEDDSTAYLIDFGLSKKFVDDKGFQIPYREDVRFEGTKVFSSVHVLNGIERAPRDDLESLWYCLVLLHKNKLPWTDDTWNPKFNFPETMLVNNLRMSSVKMMYRRNLCRGMQPSFRSAWKIVATMGYDGVPDYSRLKDLLLAAAREHCHKHGLGGSTKTNV